MTYIADVFKTKKRLENFEKELLKQYARKEYPKFELFIKHVLAMLDKYSVNEFKEDSNNSYYENLTNFIKFMFVDELPLEYDKIASAYIDDYASTLDFRSNSLKPGTIENFRDMLKVASPIYGMKSNSKAYDFYLRAIGDFTYFGEDKNYNVDVFFNGTNFDVSNLPPDFLNISNQLKVKNITGTFQVGDTLTGSISGVSADIANVYTDRNHFYLDTSSLTPSLTHDKFTAGDLITGSVSGATAEVISHVSDTVILSEIPYYKYDETSGIPIPISASIEEYQKGSRPYEYQLVAGQSDFNISGLQKIVDINFRPAGFTCWIFVKINDVLGEINTDVMCFPKIYIHTGYPDIRVVTSATEGYGAGEFPPIEWAYQGIPIYISGTVTPPYGSPGAITNDYILYDTASSTWVDSSDPLFTWGIIDANSDFPLPYSDSSGVRDGDLYIINTAVTDDDASKTNTGQSFNQYKIIQWYGGETGNWF